MDSTTNELTPAQFIRKEKTGELSSDILQDLIGDAVVEDGATQFRKIFLDLRGGEFRETVTGIYTLGPRLEARGLTHLHKVSILYSGETTYYEFLESVLHNRGLPNIKVFFSLSEAYEWLR